MNTFVEIGGIIIKDLGGGNKDVCFSSASIFLKILFIYLKERQNERESMNRGRGRGRERSRLPAEQRANSVLHSGS